MSGQKPDPTGAKILDGATRVLGDFGFKRTTVELVAKYAGVSHMTIYRRWPSKNDLLHAAVTAEFADLLDSAFEASGAESSGAGSGSFAQRALAAFADTVWALQSHPVVQRELNTEAGEQSPVPAGTSGAVMQAGLHLVTERLQRLSSAAADAPADLDRIADVFVRLAYSLVSVKRADRPLTNREQVEQYCAAVFGPYLRPPNDTAVPPPADAVVVDLDERRSSRTRSNRLSLQVAAASIFGVLTLGAGLTAVLGGNIKLPFVSPATFSRPATATTAPEPVSGPAEPGARPAAGTATPGRDGPAPATQPPDAPAAASPSPLPEISVPPIEAAQRATGGAGSVGANPAGGGQSGLDNPAPVMAPRPAPQPDPGPPPQPQPPAPQPQPPAPQPQPQPPAPQPQPPGPKPPNPGSPPPAPGPKPPPPGPKPPGPGPQQQSGPGPQQQNRPPAPPN